MLTKEQADKLHLLAYEWVWARHRRVVEESVRYLAPNMYRKESAADAAFLKALRDLTVKTVEIVPEAPVAVTRAEFTAVVKRLNERIDEVSDQLADVEVFLF